MFNKVLEIKSTDKEARQLLADCCSAMNAEYIRMKKLKRVERVSELKRVERVSELKRVERVSGLKRVERVSGLV
jgi:enolase